MAISHSVPVKIFIGSSPRNAVEEAVFVQTLLSHTSRPLEIYAINGETGSATNLKTREVKRLDESLIAAIPGATAFSLARWSIPEWCDYQGRAIYCDSDQMSFGDIAELWDYDLSGHTLAAVPFETSKSLPKYKEGIKKHLKGNGDYYLASVMVMDCEKAKVWSLATIVDWIKQQKQAKHPPDVMWLGEKFRQSFEVSVAPLAPEWNHLDWLDSSTKILHFTDLSSQPWKYHHHTLSDVWETEFLATVAAGALPVSVVQKARSGGYVSRRVASLIGLPDGVRSPVNALWRSAGASLFRLGQAVSSTVQPVRSLGRKVRSRLKRLNSVPS